MGESAGSHVEPGLEASQSNLDEIPVCSSRARPYSKIYSQENTTSARTATTTSHATAVMNRFNSTQTACYALVAPKMMTNFRPYFQTRKPAVGTNTEPQTQALWAMVGDSLVPREVDKVSSLWAQSDLPFEGKTKETEISGDTLAKTMAKRY